MKWARAVHHVESLAEQCAERGTIPSSLFPFRVTELWAVGDVLGPPQDLEHVTVALCVDLPADDVPWWSEPPGAQHWANATRLSKNPILPWWRSAHTPVWNHRIERPALVWDQENGLSHETVAALYEGNGQSVRQAAPSQGDLHDRLVEELSVSRRSLRACSDAFEARRWRPGRIEPVADHLWRAADGYLDVLAALDRLNR